MVDNIAGPILRIVPGVLAVGLLGESLKVASSSFPKNNFNMKMRIPGKPMTKMRLMPYKANHSPNVKPFVKGATNIIVGTALIGGIAAGVNSI